VQVYLKSRLKIIALVLSLFCAGGWFCGSTPLYANDASSGFLKSIELMEQRDREKQEWNRLRGMLETEVEYLEKQLEESRRRVDDLTREQTEALEKRKELLAKQSREEQWVEKAILLRNQMASRATALAEALPPWMAEQKKITLFSESRDSTSLNWMDTFLRQMAEVLQDNQRIESRDTIISMPNGEDMRVRILSFGLAGAYYSSPGAGTAGWYFWNGKKWQRESSETVRPSLQSALAQMEGREEPDLVILPIRMLSGETE